MICAIRIQEVRWWNFKKAKKGEKNKTRENGVAYGRSLNKAFAHSRFCFSFYWRVGCTSILLLIRLHGHNICDGLYEPQFLRFISLRFANSSFFRQKFFFCCENDKKKKSRTVSRATENYPKIPIITTDEWYFQKNALQFYANFINHFTHFFNSLLVDSHLILFTIQNIEWMNRIVNIFWRIRMNNNFFFFWALILYFSSSFLWVL